MWVRLLIHVVLTGKTYGFLPVPELLQDGTWPTSKAGKYRNPKV